MSSRMKAPVKPQNRFRGVFCIRVYKMLHKPESGASSITALTLYPPALQNKGIAPRPLHAQLAHKLGKILKGQIAL
jgi:hypothetical protein